MTSLATLLCLVLGSCQDASEGTTRAVVAKDGETIALRVRVSDPATHVLTVVAFPEPVTELVSAWNPKDLSLEEHGGRLFVKLFAKAEGHIDVLVASGMHYRLYIAPVAATGGAWDSLVTIARPAAPAAERTTGPGTASAGGAIELVRAMRLGKIPEGASVRGAGKAAPILATEDLVIRPVWLYEAARFRGWIVEFENRSRENYRLDLSRLQAPGLVLAGSRDIVVAPRGRTRLYLIFAKE